jgi:pimeloyl-ACP methyl ester carboxylesterase
MITNIPQHLLAALLTTTPIGVPGPASGHFDAATQELAGCWLGQIGEGTAQRRAILRINRGSGGWTGALHVLNRSVSADSIVGAELSGQDFVVRVAATAGERVLRGRLDDNGGLNGGLESGVEGAAVLPFWFTAVEAGEDGARKLVGYWSGTLEQNAFPMRIGLKWREAPCGQVHVTMDSPDQNVMDLPVTSLSVGRDSVRFAMSYLDGSFRGAVRTDGKAMAGSWAQGPGTFEVSLTRGDSAPKYRRPQEPVGAVPYDAEEVVFENPWGRIRLAGTLTLPRGTGRHAVVVLVSGSGSQDRDELVAGHRPFLVLADHLTRQGIAVLRVDDRGVGRSGGDAAGETMMVRGDDVLAAIEFLKKHSRIDTARIGLLGHSEGGWVVPMVAERSMDVRFVVMLASPAVSGEELLIAQQRAILAASGSTEAEIAAVAVDRELFAILKKIAPDSVMRRRVREEMPRSIASLSAEERSAVRKQWGSEPADSIARSLRIVLMPWFRALLVYDPRPSLSRLRVPLLALYGERDLQVPANQSVPVLEDAMRAADNRDYAIEVLPGLNHLFQHARTGLLDEYSTIEETMDTQVLERVSRWILERTGGM